MAPSKPAQDLNAMIAADRLRRKNANIAAEIFGKNRRVSAPGKAGQNNRKAAAAVPSLASRIGTAGITKRTITSTTKPRAIPANNRPSAGNVYADWTHDLHSLNNPASRNAGILDAPRGPKGRRENQVDRFDRALHGSTSSPVLNSQFNIVGVSKPASSISIKGLAGPYVVIAKNLSPGTSAADIESAMTPVGGVVISCRLISEQPKVIAELIFETKEGADNVVDTFNNQSADGNILQVYHKIGPAPATLKKAQTPSSFTPAIDPQRASTPLGPRADNYTSHSDDNRAAYSSAERYAPSRERSRDRRRDYDRDDVMDGSYGFEDRMDTDEDKGRNGGAGGLYSDTMIGSRGGRGNGNYSNNNRDRGGGRGGDRSRGYR